MIIATVLNAMRDFFLELFHVQQQHSENPIINTRNIDKIKII